MFDDAPPPCLQSESIGMGMPSKDDLQGTFTHL